MKQRYIDVDGTKKPFTPKIYKWHWSEAQRIALVRIRKGQMTNVYRLYAELGGK